MKKIETTVCNNIQSGTDRTVFIKFQFNGGDYCRTANLDTADLGHIFTNDWARGETQTWGHQSLENLFFSGTREHNFLGDCSDFLAKDQLMAQVEIPVQENDLRPYLIDDLEICNLKVTFGKKDQPGYSVWEWDGKWTGNGEQEGEWK